MSNIYFKAARIFFVLFNQSLKMPNQHSLQRWLGDYLRFLPADLLDPKLWRRGGGGGNVNTAIHNSV